MQRILQLVLPLLMTILLRISLQSVIVTIVAPPQGNHKGLPLQWHESAPKASS